MKQQYPKFRSEYEEDYWRKMSNRQALNQKIIISIVIIISVSAASWFGTDPNHKAKLEIIKLFQRTPVVQFPANGTTTQYLQDRNSKATFTVISSPDKDKDCIVKMEDWDNGNPIVELYVHAGERAVAQSIPLGDYRIKFICGTQWYGNDEMFGKGIDISIGLKQISYPKSENSFRNVILTLTKKIDGNFKTSDSKFNKY